VRRGRGDVAAHFERLALLVVGAGGIFGVSFQRMSVETLADGVAA
jgi:hypothetical protein